MTRHSTPRSLSFAGPRRTRPTRPTPKRPRRTKTNFRQSRRRCARCRSPAKYQRSEHAIGQQRISDQNSENIIGLSLGRIFLGLGGLFPVWKTRRKTGSQCLPGQLQKGFVGISPREVRCSGECERHLYFDPGAETIRLRKSVFRLPATRRSELAQREIRSLLRRADQSICRRNKRTVWCRRVRIFSRSF